MRLMFSHRQEIETIFEAHCLEHGTANCAGNFLAWLLTSPRGNEVVIDLYHDVMVETVRMKHLETSSQNQNLDTLKLL